MKFLHETLSLLSCDRPTIYLIQKTHRQYVTYSLLLPVWTVPNDVKATMCDMAYPQTSLHHTASISFQTSLWLMRGTHWNGPTDKCSRNSSVSVTTGLWGGKIGVRFRAGRTELCLIPNVHTNFGSQKASYPTDNAAGARSCPPTPSSAEFKNEWSYNLPPPLCVHGVDRDNVTFF